MRKIIRRILNKFSNADRIVNKNYLKEIENFCHRFNITLEQAEGRLRERIGENCLYCKTKNSKGQQLIALYFAVISINNQSITDILEIGTGLGMQTDILSRLFSEAHIYTLDLSHFDKEFNSLALRKNKEDIFQKNINKKNVTFIESNSFFMPSLDMPHNFDFVWVDGGHCYPAVAWDIMFAYNHLKKGGFVFMDDYNRPGTDVKKVIDYIRPIIKEEIHFLPWAGYAPTARICWLKKK